MLSFGSLCFSSCLGLTHTPSAMAWSSKILPGHLEREGWILCLHAGYMQARPSPPPSSHAIFPLGARETQYCCRASRFDFVFNTGLPEFFVFFSLGVDKTDPSASAAALKPRIPSHDPSKILQPTSLAFSAVLCRPGAPPADPPRAWPPSSPPSRICTLVRRRS